MHTNKKSGVLLATSNGVAFTLLQITLPRHSSPNSLPSVVAVDPIPPSVTGLTPAHVDEAIAKVLANMNTMTF